MTEPKRPREWTVPRAMLTHVSYTSPHQSVCVIEKSAYDALLKQAMALREALFCCAGLNDDYRAKSADKALAAFDRFLAKEEK